MKFLFVLKTHANIYKMKIIILILMIIYAFLIALKINGSQRIIIFVLHFVNLTFIILKNNYVLMRT